MNVVVSNNAIPYEDFIKVSKLKEVLSITGKIDILVIHKTNEKEEEKVKCLSLLKDKVSLMVYIREKDCVDQAIQMIVLGTGGKYFDDEFFLESSSELKNLLENLEEVTAIAELGGVNVVSDFFNRYLRDGSSSFSKNYLLMVKEAVSGMLTEYKQKDLELLQLSETATEIFANSVSLISKVEEERENLQNAISKLSDSKSIIMQQPKPTTPLSQSIIFFPQVSYIKEQQIVRIKSIGDFSHLIPFCLGLRLYLEQVKLLRTKLIVVCPVGRMYEDIYKNYEWVTQQSYKDMKGFSNIVFTNFPNKDVICKLLGDINDYDTYIIVDMLKAEHKHILNSRGSSVKYAVSSERLVSTYNLKIKDCFFNKDVSGSMFALKHDFKYPDEVEQRERYYLREYKDIYELFNY